MQFAGNIVAWSQVRECMSVYKQAFLQRAEIILGGAILVYVVFFSLIIAVLTGAIQAFAIGLFSYILWSAVLMIFITRSNYKL